MPIVILTRVVDNEYRPNFLESNGNINLVSSFVMCSCAIRISQI